jgi:hypothetical protein
MTDEDLIKFLSPIPAHINPSADTNLENTTPIKPSSNNLNNVNNNKSPELIQFDTPVLSTTVVKVTATTNNESNSSEPQETKVHDVFSPVMITNNLINSNNKENNNKNDEIKNTSDVNLNESNMDLIDDIIDSSDLINVTAEEEENW